MKARRNRLAGAVALLLGATTLGAAMLPIASDPVMTASGKVSGTRLAGVRAYLGIPYAAPPVGQLRWAAPQPMHWDGIFNADRTGAECIQVLRPHDINHYFGEEPTSENCLTLNLWTPTRATPASKLPVVVFIYGGGFTVGSSGMPNYGGEPIARAGAVFVNFNYRVGAFGFLAHPALTAEQGGHSGNYGLMDQIAALKWVQANIAKFGGDPSKVLIVGQSAGASSVASHLFSPLSKGLFRAAAMSSGCNFASTGPVGAGELRLADAEKTGVQLQERLGAADLAAMRQVPADRILGLQSESQLGVHVDAVRIGGPIIDGYVLTAPRAELLTAGSIARVPIIASYNGDDIDVGMSPLGRVKTLADYQKTVREMWGADADAVLERWPATDSNVVAVAKRAATMNGLESSSRRCARGVAPLGVSASIDEFTRKHPYVPGVRIADQDIATIGAYHTADIPYWFGTLDAYNSLRATRDWTAWDRSLSTRMMGAMIAFAATGSPSTPAMQWPAWKAGAETKLVLGDTVTVEPLDTTRLDWLAAHPAKAIANPAAQRVRD
ncbi:carboxylesterase family protein [Polymorphobacter sp. PAMC 29334]|uniref:carboxylesterase/lipase family protein n=1 Tax=Polymorphobacter sp. PAMC 29334 TaxID=2862331 RepID=UPI001C67426A|nr:carboxylesterase family protein [Polymorphobacter sp. PAMC 29334]QYE36398.1 carboxylesterase family protein [Polymorphobacter sp. PAMC 29334]